MQSYKMDEIIESVCEKKHLNKELMKSFSDFIFSSTKKEMSKFENLRIYLRGFIIFFYGKSRLEKFKERVATQLEEREKGIAPKYASAFLSRQDDEELSKTRDGVNHLLSVYDEYISEKKTTKAKFKEDRANEYKEKIS